MNVVISRRSSIAVTEGQQKGVFARAFGPGYDTRSKLLTDSLDSIKKSIDDFKFVLDGERAAAVYSGANMVSDSRMRHVTAQNKYLEGAMVKLQDQIAAQVAESAKDKAYIASLVDSVMELKESHKILNAEKEKATSIATKAVKGFRKVKVELAGTQEKLRQTELERDQVQQVLADVQTTLAESSSNPNVLTSLAEQLNELVDENTSPKQQVRTTPGLFS